jgi:dihydroxy-acid dehydratase
LVENGDLITIDAETNAICLEVSEEILQKRRKKWSAPKLKFDRGVLYKYARTVSSASKGCVTDEF